MAKMPDLEQFNGRWALTRVIKDRLTETEGRLSGQATFTAQEDGAYLYLEEGELNYGDQTPMAASRKYIWRQKEKGIAIQFEDGRDFHMIEADKLMPDAMHHCDPDMYHVSYDFTSWPNWRAAWRVVGPRKDYRMMSSYARA
ncbi:MAG: DUF6314 family protein [Pseudomonadota bacterium]